MYLGSLLWYNLMSLRTNGSSWLQILKELPHHRVSNHQCALNGNQWPKVKESYPLSSSFSPTLSHSGLPPSFAHSWGKRMDLGILCTQPSEFIKVELIYKYSYFWSGSTKIFYFMLWTWKKRINWIFQVYFVYWLSASLSDKGKEKYWKYTAHSWRGKSRLSEKKNGNIHVLNLKQKFSGVSNNVNPLLVG